MYIAPSNIDLYIMIRQLEKALKSHKKEISELKDRVKKLEGK